jgi:hypothetical protein
MHFFHSKAPNTLIGLKKPDLRRRAQQVQTRKVRTPGNQKNRQLPAGFP